VSVTEKQRPSASPELVDRVKRLESKVTEHEEDVKELIAKVDAESANIDGIFKELDNIRSRKRSTGGSMKAAS